MKAKFESLKEQAVQLTSNQLVDAIEELVSEIETTDNRLLSVDRQWRSHGTWLSVGFANEFYFGKELSILLVKAISNSITHDEDKQFCIAEFSEEIKNSIFDLFYFNN